MVNKRFAVIARSRSAARNPGWWRPHSRHARESAAADVAVVLVDRFAEQCAERTTDQRAADAVTATVDDIAENAAAGSAKDQPGRAVVPLAVIASVGAAIDLVVWA